LALAVSLSLTRKAMIPLVLALFLTQIMSPVVSFFRVHLRLPRALALAAASLVGGALIATVVLVITSAFRQLLVSSDLYREKFLSLADVSISRLQGWGLDLDRAFVLNQLRDLPFFEVITQAAGQFVNFFTLSFLVLVFMVFLVSGKRTEAKRSKIFLEIDSKIRKYLVVKIVSSLVTGLLVAFILWALGLEMAALFGLLAALLNFIPTLGSIIATLLPVPVALLQFESMASVLLVLILPGVVQFSIGNLIEPRFVGKSLDLHPATVLVSLMLWTLIWGIPGAFLAVPMTVVLKIALERIPTTRAFAELMAGRFELSED
jgi:AI-2 transport protein TqsA